MMGVRSGNAGLDLGAVDDLGETLVVVEIEDIPVEVLHGELP